LRQQLARRVVIAGSPRIFACEPLHRTHVFGSPPAAVGDDLDQTVEFRERRVRHPFDGVVRVVPRALAALVGV